MDKDKLTQGELLDELGLAFNGALLKAVAYKWRRPQIQQTYTQLKEIVKEHFEFIALKKAYGQDRSLDKKVQQKPTVSRRWVEDAALFLALRVCWDDEKKAYEFPKLADGLIYKLKEAGVEVGK